MKKDGVKHSSAGLHCLEFRDKKAKLEEEEEGGEGRRRRKRWFFFHLFQTLFCISDDGGVLYIVLGMQITAAGGVNVDEFLQNGDLGSEEDNVVRRFLEELLGFPLPVQRRDELFQRLQLVRHGGVGRRSVSSGAGAALTVASPASGSSPGLSHCQVAGARRRPRPHLLGSSGSKCEAEMQRCEREKEEEEDDEEGEMASALYFFLRF